MFKKVFSRKLLPVLMVLLIVSIDFTGLSPIAKPISVHAAGTVEKVVVSQIGYSASDLKTASVVATDALTDLSYQINNGTSQVYSGTMTDEGVHWGKRVYSIDFTSFTTTGTNFTIRTNGIDSYIFPINTNNWNNYLDEMTAYYRVQRAHVATSASLPAGYTNTSLSAEAYHPAGHLDDAYKNDKSTHVDVTGGWYDAGDYGQYGGNAWVGGEIALAYLRHSGSANVRFDRDSNYVPDLLDEAKVDALRAIKMIDSFGGAYWNIRNRANDNDMGPWVHPEKVTDGVIGTADDRYADRISVGGSAKAAGMLAATARAFAQAAIDPTFQSNAQQRAITAYNYAYNNQSGDEGSYGAIGGIGNSLLWAEVELYLLTNNTTYRDRANARIDALTFNDIRTTNYWDLRPLSLIEYYPAADATRQTNIQNLLKSRLQYFISMTDDTPYGVLDEFSDFGVNEPHMSYVADAIRYYEQFGDASALRAAKKGLYWVFGNNPWNISWVSGLGANAFKYPHSRLDEDAQSNPSNPGITIPGAMVAGPNMKDPNDPKSASPWYQDRSVYTDNSNQWRYNEHSLSIQVGLLYSMVAMTKINSNPAGGIANSKTPILSPQIGDYVTGDVKIFAAPQGSVSGVDMAVGNETSTYSAMTNSSGIYTSTLNVNSYGAYATPRVVVRANETSGQKSYSATHLTKAPDLPSPSTPLLYDDFGGNGLWGSKGWGWANWYNQNGGWAEFQQTTDGTRTVGKFTHHTDNAIYEAKFQPWHDVVDLNGYSYVDFTVRNPGAATVQAIFRIEDKSDGEMYNLSASYVNTPTTYTTLHYNIGSATKAWGDGDNVLNKAQANIQIWLKAGTTDGIIYVDEIKAVNDASGNAPTLTAGSVSPSSGDVNATYTFNVTYTDSNNDAPYKVQLVVDGVVRDMVATNSADTTYTDGKGYTFSTKLYQGTHSYYFRTTDTKTNVVSTATVTGPTVTGGSVPTTTKHEGENATGVNQIDTWPGGYSGTGIGVKYPGSAMTWAKNFAGGTYSFTVQANDYAGTQTFYIQLDGVDKAGPFTMTAGDKSWKTFTGSLGTVSAGNHTIGLRAAGSSNIYCDYIEVSGP